MEVFTYHLMQVSYYRKLRRARGRLGAALDVFIHRRAYMKIEENKRIDIDE